MPTQASLVLGTEGTALAEPYVVLSLKKVKSSGAYPTKQQI